MNAIIPLTTDVECVLFDLDGTLADTAADFIHILNVMLTAEDRETLPPLRIRQTVSDGARGLVQLAFGGTPGEAEFDARLNRLLSLYQDRLQASTAELFEGLDPILLGLEAADIPWGIVTNKPERYTQRVLEHLDLVTRCRVVVCPDHVANRKPDPEGLLLACRKLDCAPVRSVYVGDHIRDMQAARHAELIAVAAAWGYLGANDQIEEWPAEFIVNTPAELAPLLAMLRFA